jgi:hypothetical protein
MSQYSGSQAARSRGSGYSKMSGAAGANQTYAEKKTQALAAKNTSVLSFDELERIKSMCSQTNEQEDYMNMRQHERQTLQNISN